jgi:methyl-accepting chemotaxis protein/methyl-accepting chemotaxis protein-3 (ribose and galactose sensor receptor)
MKISHRLALIILCAATGFVILCAYSLYVVRDSMISERKAATEIHVRMAGNLIAQFQAAEKAGKLSREEAQRQAAQAIRGMRYQGDYMYLRSFSGLSIVHPDKRKEGKTDGGGTLSDGRTLMQGYRDVLANSDFGYVSLYTKRVNGNVDVPKINGVLKIADWDWIVGTGVFLDDIDAIFWKRVWQFLGIGVVVLSCVIGLAVWMSRSIYRVLGGEPAYAAQVAQAIAAGTLNQRIDGQASTDSLLGAMARMQEQLRGMVSLIQHNASQLNHSAHGINQQMVDMTDMANQASDAATSTTAAIQQLSNSVLHISDNAQRTQTQSARAATLAADGGALVNDAASHIQHVSEQLEQASSQIAALDQRAAEIGGIAGVIKDIADQTNLLALNAAIEAARAGEQGRGFAVVADEVRKLAERTTEATTQISNMIGAVQRDTRDVVGSMGAAAPQVESSVGKAQSAARALEEIRAGAALALDNIRDVASATQEQSVANQRVAEHIERIANMVAQSADTASQARHSAQQLEVLADELNAAVAKFQV